MRRLQGIWVWGIPIKRWEKSEANFSKDRCGGFKNELGIDLLIMTFIPAAHKRHLAAAAAAPQPHLVGKSAGLLLRQHINDYSACRLPRCTPCHTTLHSEDGTKNRPVAWLPKCIYIQMRNKDLCTESIRAIKWYFALLPSDQGVQAHQSMVMMPNTAR